MLSGILAASHETFTLFRHTFPLSSLIRDAVNGDSYILWLPFRFCRRNMIRLVFVVNFGCLNTMMNAFIMKEKAVKDKPGVNISRWSWRRKI